MTRRARTRLDVENFSLKSFTQSEARVLAPAKKEVLELLEAKGDVFSRQHFLPGHLTASAFLIDPASRSLFLILHKKLNLWLQPGGHVEAEDDDMLAAATRELIEETGAKDAKARAGLFDIDVHEIPAHGLEPGHRHYDLRYAFDVASISPRLTDEVKDARFFSFEFLALHSDDASMKRVAQRLLSQ